MKMSRLSRFLSHVQSIPVLPRLFLSASVSPPLVRKLANKYGPNQHSLPTRVSSPVIQLIQGTFRGIGQVAFVNSAITGALIYVGCSLSSPLAALLGLLCTFLCTLLGYLIKSERERSVNGLHGYNGFLVGMGIGYFDTGLSVHHSGWYHFGLLLVPMVLTGFLCFFVHLGLSRSVSVPPFTFAYNISLSCWLAFAVSLGSGSEFYPVFVSPEIAPVSPARIEYSAIDFSWFVRSVLAGVGQVYFSPELVPSILTTCALLIGSPIAGLLALLGSTVGTGVAILAHSAAWSSEIGLDGLSAVLCAIGAGGFVFVTSRWSIVVAIFGSIFCVSVRHVFSGLLVHPTGPAMTLPFCFIATIIVVASKHIPVITRVPHRLLDSCETHLANRLDAELIFAEIFRGKNPPQDQLQKVTEWPDLDARLHSLDALE